MTTTANESIDFIQFHEPSLKSGEYTLTLDQQISVPDTANAKTSTTETYTQTQHFFVAGDRFAIKPQDIHVQFPPRGNDGDHSNVLPHIVLTRSTLPWERDADPEDSELPWLWLFLYDDQDLAEGRVTLSRQNPVNSLVNFLDPQTGKALKNNNRCTSSAVELEAEPQENLSQKVDALNVNAQWLENQNIVPSANALKLLTSVRKNTQENGDATEWAMCIANRLPFAGGKSYAHLVTLENRFSKGEFDFSKNLDEKGHIQFISLAHWHFHCPDDIRYQASPHALQKLQKNTLSPALINDIEKLPAKEMYLSSETFKKALNSVIDSANEKEYTQQQALIFRCLTAPTATFKGLLDQVNRGNLRLPILNASGDDAKYLETANQYIQRGAIGLPHYLREGGETVSWYHGPFIDGTDTDQLSNAMLPVSLPVRSSDQLLRFDTRLGMFDVSYAAAWELGRLIMLDNRDMAMRLYAWKRQHAWNLKQQEQSLLYDHLPFADGKAGQKANADHADKLGQWFNDLNLLYKVPFNYLVPNEALLPNESIRFFTLDSLWVESLMDGAFSIGRVTETDHQRDKALSNTAKAQYPQISGFLLNSEVVAGWPSLNISGSSLNLKEAQMPEQNSPLSILRKQTLAPNLLLCLFDGPLSTVDIHLAPEALHFGFDRPFAAHTTFYKELKILDSGEITSPLKTVNITWLDNKTDTTDTSARVVDIETLAKNIASSLAVDASQFTSAQFSLEMIEGIPRIRFQTGNSA